jgi:osmotically-inducible protein OsmY
MSRGFIALALSAGLALVGCSRSNREAAPPSSKPAETMAPNNTGINERDRGGATVTPMDQSNSETDLKITQELRQQLVNDDALSFDAKNIKIITTGAVITLRGPVKSQTEKQVIDSQARAIPGVASINNELEVKGE